MGILWFLSVANASAATADSKRVFVALGDSITAGSPAFRSPAESPPHGEGDQESQYSYWIEKRHPEWKIHNRGILGERSDQILRRFESDVLPYKPEIVIVLAGVNDLYQGYPAGWIKTHLTAIYDRAAQENIRALACTIVPYNTASRQVRDRMEEVNLWIREYSLKKGLGFCDTYHAIEDPARLGFLKHSDDGLHPNVAGYRDMGNAIADCLRNWMAKDTPSR